MKILVVDDETDLEVLIKQKFRKQIRQNEYQFVFAINGKDALDKLQIEPDMDIVLSDINMPEMDGLTLLSKLNELNPLLKSVIVSAYGDMENIRTAMNRGAFDFITKPINFEDLTITMEKTLKYARQIKDTLKAVKENNILKMYVDENVLNFMGSREYESTIMANETIEGTVMFIDLCGFTKISETFPADTVVKMINTYFDEMVKEIMEHQGFIDKFIGDGLMAFFGAPISIENPTLSAVKASLEMRERLDKLNEKWRAEGRQELDNGIGLHTGYAHIGNVGSDKKMDYTAIGDSVNIASRVEGVTKNLKSAILITHECQELVHNDIISVPKGEVPLKGRAPVFVYEVQQLKN